MYGARETYYIVPQYIQYLAVGKTKVRIKPPTAGVRILSIDGGGVRGIVPLEFLNLLQVEVGSEIPLESLFDQVFGTSSGKLATSILLSSIANRQSGWANYFRAVRKALDCCRMYLDL